MADGIHTHAEIEALVASGAISAERDVEPDQVQPTSLDLRLGPRAWRIRAGFLPARAPVHERLKQLQLFEIDLDRGAVLEPGHIYLVELEERIRLPGTLRARCNPKSSTGRIDLFTRVITDFAERFDDLPAGYSGPLFLEIMPRSFPVRVRRGTRLNQVRIVEGRSLLTDEEHRAEHRAAPLVADENGRPTSGDLLAVDGGLRLCVSLEPQADGVIGYRARRFTGVIDLEKPRGHDAAEFFEPIREQSDSRLLLEPEEFYIFASRERIRVPPHLAAEMLPYDVGIGELRTNYAGFFDAGFGFGAAGELKGTPAVLEVRPHDVPYLIEHGQVFFRLAYHRTVRRCERLYGAAGAGSNYAHQGVTLAKYFR